MGEDNELKTHKKSPLSLRARVRGEYGKILAVSKYGKIDA